MPSWIDLATTDLDSARDFYSNLFGWTTRVAEQTEARGHTLFLKDDKPVAGAGTTMSPDQPAAWTMYVATDDAQAVAAKVEGANGKVLMPPTDVFDSGRMAVFMDTTGAQFAVWQAGKHPGGEVFNEPGTYTWSELTTREPDTAKEFYRHVFGWSGSDQRIGQIDYTTFRLNGVAAAGLMPMAGDQWPADLPSHWMNYVAVADADATAEKATRLGGAVGVAPTDIPPGRFAVISDPQGAHLSIIKLNPDFPRD
jgi:predicted enzyme related to lactoylglutathione lyase